MAITYAYAGDIDLQKSKPDEKGFLDVYGIASSPREDLDEQICDPAWLKSAVPDWYQWANVRAMHGSVAAGVGKELEHGEGDQWWLKSKVVDKDSIDKVTEGVYKGYSVGIRNAKVIKDAKARGGRIVGGTIVEISLVDRPCNPDAVMSLAKAQGAALAPVDVAGVVIAKFDEADDAPAAVEDVVEAGASEVVEPTVEADDTVKTTLALDGKAVAEKVSAPSVRSARIMTPRAHRAAVETMEKALAGEFGTEGVLLKSAGVNDETGDIAGAWAAIGAIADLIISEATELKTGRGEEIYDIKILTEAVCALKYFISNETQQDGAPAGPLQPDDSPAEMADTFASIDMAAEAEVVKSATVDDDGVETEPDFIALATAADGAAAIIKAAPVEVVPVVEPAVELVVEAPAPVEAVVPVADIVKTKWTQEKRDAARAAGHTLSSSDDSYPIEDASDVEHAVGLVGNGNAPKGKVKRHIMAQAKRIGAMDKIPDSWNPNTSGKAIGADLEKQLDVDEPKINDVPTAAFDKSAVAEYMAEALTKAIAPLQTELASVKGELAQVKAMPVPGGPFIIAPPQPVAAINNKSDQAARYRLMADQASDPGVASAYRAKAREVESTKD